MRKELDKLSRGVACLSLRDVRGHRNSRSAHLRDDPEFLLARERLSHLIDLLCKCHTLLPNLKVLVIPNHLGRRVCPFFTHHLSLITYHLPLTPIRTSAPPWDRPSSLGARGCNWPRVRRWSG